MEFDEHRPAVHTPDGRYLYQLHQLDGDAVENLVNVWKRTPEGTLRPLMMISVGEDGGPAVVGVPRGELGAVTNGGYNPKGSASPATVDAYLAAAGHLWAAHQADLWGLNR